MRDWDAILSTLQEGDIFHAKSPNGASLICLVLTVTPTSIHARTVTHQIDLEFARSTGVATYGKDQVPCTIDSISPLPVDVKNAFLGLDKRFRPNLPESECRLTDAEKHALIFVYDFYREHQL